ncbi:MAG: hypothetical protein K9N46_01680 [Candidatus Marinimicrobia bacterium]|nr:hypothetical protein [Candidatus Neomarinimicrobiota bacterium]MCF7827812.1 hypothetical protein [Candidatus Neomarinimicrobiota bacterium]MCF7879433.1 hypothetical protein [Candidatus Neomarinimicrobiota bacterium]
MSFFAEYALRDNFRAIEKPVILAKRSEMSRQGLQWRRNLVKKLLQKLAEVRIIYNKTVGAPGREHRRMN